MNKKLTALFLCSTLISSMGIQAIAAETTASPITVSAPSTLPSSALYYGQVTELVKNEQGVITQIHLDSEHKGPYIFHISNETVWIDSGNRVADDPSDLKVGEGIYVFHSPVTTASLPPQSAALAIVRNMPQDVGAALYYEVFGVTKENGILNITTDQENVVIKADEKTTVSPYQTKNIVTLEDIKAGDRIMVWNSATMSPDTAQRPASHIMILPTIAAEDLAEGTPLTIELNGKEVEITGRYEQGVPMIPVAAVGRTLGFEVIYTPEETGGKVQVESEDFSVQLRFGEALIYGVTKIEGAVGMTAPQDFGAAVYVVDPGTTWAPAELFTLLGKTVSLDGTKLIINE